MSEAEANPQAEGAEAAAADGSLIDEIISNSKISPEQEGFDMAKEGVSAFVAEMLKPNHQGEKVDKRVVDAMISDIDQRLSSQLDEILHHEQFQKLESSWRGLKMLVDRTNFRENVKINVLNASKEDLLDDFEDSPEVAKSGLYKWVYTGEYGQFGGEPYAAMIANYDFGPGPQDVSLLQNVASVATMAHAPFISAADPKFFGAESFTEVPNLKDLQSIFEGPQYAKWRSFRESEDSRSVGLTCPRFLLRLPYGQETVPVKAFNYEEKVTDNHESYLWGNTAFAFATRLTDSFAKFRWCPNIIGPAAGGSVDDLPVHVYEGAGGLKQKIPTETLISDRREYELAEEGFIPLVLRKGADNACFFSANSAQKPKTFANTEEGKAAETNYKLGTQLPYMFVINRLAHYIKVLQREAIGSTKSRTQLQDDLNKWISQYVANMDVAPAGVFARRPLREASIDVSDVEGDPGWYRVNLQVRPHMKYMGAFFSLSLVGKLDKS